MNKYLQPSAPRNPFLKTGDVVYVYSGRRSLYVVISIKHDGFEAIKEGSNSISFHHWSDIKRWSNKKADMLNVILPANSNSNIVNRRTSPSAEHR